MSKTVVIGGVEVHIDGDGPETVLMLHGWPDTYRLWDRQVEAMQSQYRCVRFSLPGFEREQLRRTWTLDEIMALIKQIIGQLSPGQPVILMLHDWGCVFGYEFYVRHPALVSRIIGVDVGDVKALRRVLKTKEALYIFSYQGWLALAWRLGGRIGDWMTRAMARVARCPTPQARIHAGMTYPYYLQWFGGSQSYRRQLHHFFPECPMLYVYAARKPVMFHTAGWIERLQALPGNAVVRFDSGHWVMIEQPEAFNRVVSEWLSAAPAARAAVA